MFSISFFVALVVAIIAVYMVRHAETTKALHKTKVSWPRCEGRPGDLQCSLRAECVGLKSSNTRIAEPQGTMVY